MLLAYPAFIAEHGDDSAGGERGRLTGVCTLVVVFHLSVVVSTVVGAGVLALPQPRIGISAFALVDTALAVLTHRVLGRRPGTGAGTAAAEEAPDAAPSPPHPRAPAASRRLSRITVLAYAALIGVMFDFSANVARPFFTEFSDGLGSGSIGSAVLFFLPSVSALAVLPLVRRCHDRLGDRLLPLALAVGAAGMAWTWLADSVSGVAGGRLLYGVGLGLGQVAVELRMFRATGTRGPAFTAVETVRSAGLLAAPLAATAAVAHDLALPLAVAAVGQLCAAALSLKRFRGAAPDRALWPGAAEAVEAAAPARPSAADSFPRAPAMTAAVPHASPAHSEENHR
jgi:hypothetical protein